MPQISILWNCFSSVHNIQPLINKTYPVADSASGIWIYNRTGQSWMDGSSGAITCSLGHSHPRILQAMQQQASRLQFVYRSQFGSEAAEALAARLCELSPGGVYAHSFFVNSGTEAMETAMKVAWQHWQEQGLHTKKLFITRKKSYHGITQGALSLTGHPLRRKRFEDQLENYPVLAADMEETPLETQVEELEQTIARLGADQVAAFVAEPVVGAAGAAIHPPPGYYQAVAEVCRRNRILFIADEVMTGLGRTGEWFGLNHWETTADILAVGKSLGAGYAPIAATLMTSRVLEPIRNGSGLIMSGHTYSAHPLSCAVALEVLNTLRDSDLLANCRVRGSQLLSGLREMMSEFDIIHKVRGIGLMCGVEFDASSAGIQRRVIDACFEEGLLVYPSVGGVSGSDENAVLIAPPLIITESQLDQLLTKWHLALRIISQKQ